AGTGGGGSIDPAANQTITGDWQFADTTAPTVAAGLIPTLDFDSGEPIPGQGVELTAQNPGTGGNHFVVLAVTPPGEDVTTSDQALAVTIYNDGDQGDVLYITLPTDSSFALLPVTAADLVTAINAANVPVTAAL